MTGPVPGFALRYAALFATLAAIVLALFGLVQLLDVELLDDPERSLTDAGAWFAAVGVALLVADVALPVPSSLVVAALATRYGIGVGALIGVTGTVGGALVGFAIGRRGGPLLDRLVPNDERAEFDRWFDRRGAVVILSRPVPVVSESVAVLAGTTSMGLRPFALYVALGAAPAALAFAAAGAAAESSGHGPVAFGAVAALSTVAFVWRARTESHAAASR